MQESEIDVTNVQEKGWVGKAKNWSYENWQTILIVLIVLIVGISAYNYNQGGNVENNPEVVAVADNENESENNSEDNNDNDKEDKSSDELNVSDNNQESSIENIDKIKAENEDSKETASADKEEGSVLSSSDNSGKAYTTTAKYGEGITHLARHALEEYLEDINNGSELTKEHKIYMEDYLQNKIGSQKIEIGHRETFSEDSIQEAISNAKKLSPESLKNLSKYTANIN